jgi:Ca2+-dependent lipid-binding protein
VQIPVLVSDLDLESRMWIKVRLAPMCPFLGTISLAFVGPPNIKVQLLPYNRVRLMRIPILQAFLTKLLTIDLPGMAALFPLSSSRIFVVEERAGTPWT